MASNYPTSIDDDSSLLNPADASSVKTLTTTATALILSGDSTISVASTLSGFSSTYGVLSIEDELIIYSGKTAGSFTGCARGQFGTSAIGHANGVTVKAVMVSGYLTRLKEAIIAIETALGIDGAYNFLSGSVAASDITNIPAGNISSTDVQAAINELDTEKVPTTRTITAGTGLSGGGDLSTNRTLAVSDNTTTQKVQIAKAAALVGTRQQINLIEGANVTLTVADSSGDDRVNVTIASGGSGDVIGPGSSTANHISQFSDTSGKVLKDGLGLVTTLGSPGSDSNIASEKAVRDAMIVGGGLVPGDVDYTDTFANLPGAATNGILYLPSDSYYLLRDTGAAWSYWGPLFKFTPPIALSNWTIENQGTATVEDFRGAIRFVCPASLATGIRGIYKTAPSTPYTISAAFNWCPAIIDGCLVCLGFRQSSDGKMATIRLRRESTRMVYSGKWTDYDSFSANYTSASFNWLGGNVLFLQITDDGTNRIVSVSVDGINWIPLHSVGRTDFLTADQVMFGVDNYGGSSGSYAVLLSWIET